MVTIIKTVALTPTGLEYRTAKLFIYFLNGKEKQPILHFCLID